MEMIKLTEVYQFNGKTLEHPVWIAKHAIVSMAGNSHGTYIYTNAIRTSHGATMENISYKVKETPEIICDMIG